MANAPERSNETCTLLGPCLFFDADIVMSCLGTTLKAVYGQEPFLFVHPGMAKAEHIDSLNPSVGIVMEDVELQ